ncbi:c-type cytochrome domain-containing protein [Fimbriiglobus ruber]|uniref:High-affnity carbon uptake protein Hat/HatR n=1 Tax=Fimbriiglobus ruber TaxID=1908690 RepID=A0A225DD23_9BACT|nr:c-type cytochrome domain-containing protein [Fimbriiglobus ruber]OWK36428.1 High-affnity carbon uptake protein Hat/HatR [Fimbriiglobus ruber]
MPRLRACHCILCAATAALLAFLFFGTATPAHAQQPVSFVNDVAPILKENCFACHDAKKKSGKYDMTTFEKLMTGGASGEAVVAGKPTDSDFYTLITSKDDRRMPPKDKGEAVPAAKAKIIEQWIKEGAKLDGGLDKKADLVRELRVRWKPPVPPAQYKFPTIVNALAFTPDNKALVVGGHHELTVWSVPEGKLLKRVRTRAERAYAMAFLPTGPLVVAGGRPGQEGDVRAYDLSAKGKTENGVETLDGVADKKVLLAQLLDADDSVLCLTTTPDGKKIAAGGCDRTVRVWDVSGGVTAAKLEQTIENHADWVLGVALSADGKYLATAARDKTAKVWDLNSKESVMTFPEHQNIVYAVALNKDASVGFSVGADKNLRTWKPTGEGKQIKAAGGHGDEVFKIAVNASDTIIATSSADKTVRLWDLKNVSNTKTLQGLTDYVFAIAFSPDGTLVAGGSYDGEVRVWKAADGTLVKGFNASPGYTPKPAPEAKK